MTSGPWSEPRSWCGDGIRVGKVINQHKVAKHFITEITAIHVLPEKIAAPTGCTALQREAELFDADQTVRAYKDLPR